MRLLTTLLPTPSSAAAALTLRVWATFMNALSMSLLIAIVSIPDTDRSHSSRCLGGGQSLDSLAGGAPSS
ncbi:MAG: hypothetical protein NVS2B4_20060 [Ramlibacter sp.]